MSDTKLKRYECYGDHDGKAGYSDSGFGWCEVVKICLPEDVEALEAENEALKAEIEKLKSESEWIDIKEALPSYFRPVMGYTVVVQHIVYCMDGPDDGGDSTEVWFRPYHFDYEGDHLITYEKVKKWKYVDDLMVQ